MHVEGVSSFKMLISWSHLFLKTHPRTSQNLRTMLSKTRKQERGRRKARKGKKKKQKQSLKKPRTSRKTQFRKKR